jgi:hypothetical protein
MSAPIRPVPLPTPGPVPYPLSSNNQSPPSSPKTPTRNLGNFSLYYPSSTRQSLDIDKARKKLEKTEKKLEKAEKRLEKNNIFYPTQESQNQTEVSFPNHTQLQEQNQPTFVDGGIQTDPKDDVDVLNEKNEYNNRKLQDKEQEISQLNDKVTLLSASILSEAEKTKAEKEKREQAERNMQQAKIEIQQAERDVQQAKIEIQQANQQISSSQSSNNILKAQNNILTGDLSEKENDNLSLQQQLNSTTEQTNTLQQKLNNSINETTILKQQLNNTENQTTEQLIDAYLNDVVLKGMEYDANIGIFLPFVGAAISLATWNPIPYLATTYIGLGVNEGACQDICNVRTYFKAFFLQHKEEFLIDKKAVFDKACDKFSVTFIKRTFG